MASQNSPPLESIGNYDLLEKIGDGSMGVVYKARRWKSEELVAIKVLHPHVAKNPVLLKRFEQEFRVASKLDHPNVVKVIEFSGNGGQPYYVMELIDGESLGDRLDRQGKIPEEEAIRIVVDAAHGLHRAHRQGLIHRDIKPDNIMVTRDGKAKILDLGLAKDQESSADLTRAGHGLGTPDFMAPEQFRNAKNASVRCDIYSLGATLYHMVTGKVPFNEDEPIKAMMRKLRNELASAREVNPAVTERTDWAIRRAMSANADNRPASCREFAEDLLGQSTRGGSHGDVDTGAEGAWYIVYTDADGMVRTAKGSTKAMRKAMRSGELGDLSRVRGSQSKTGPFEPLQMLLDFRDLVVGPGAGPPLSEQSMIRIGRLARPPRDEVLSPAPRARETAAPPRQEAPASEPPPASEEAPHFKMPEETAPPAAPPAWIEWAKMGLMVLATALTTLVAAHFLFFKK
jgi:serine/threonine protein kinase